MARLTSLNNISHESPTIRAERTIVMNEIKLNRPVNLQLFADGVGTAGGTATGETGTAAVSNTGGKANPLANVQYGIQEETGDAQVTDVQTTENPAVDANARFEELIKGEFKEQYNQRVQDTVQKRLKASKETVDKFNALAPTLEMLGKKYGVDATDIDALSKAIQDDDAYYEEEALERGLTVEQLKEIRKVERENADLKRKMDAERARQNADRLYASWMEQAEAVKAVYPSFDFRAEMQNPKFQDLLRSHIDVRTAYEVIHKDEIIPAAMQFAVQATEQNITNRIIANGARPIENGNASQGASVRKSDVSTLTKADRAEINRRVANGEKITFG